MSSWPEPAIWSRDPGQLIPFFDSCQLIITWAYGNEATVLFFKVWDFAYGRTDVQTDGRTDGRTDGQSRNNQFFWDRWVTKFSKVWGSAKNW